MAGLKSLHTTTNAAARLAAILVLACLTLNHSAFAGAPSNDLCANMRVITLGESAFTNLDANTDGGAVPCAGLYGHDVWFRYQSTFTGGLTVSTCGNADFDTVIVVYRGCSCASLTFLGCNDEHPSCPANTSAVTVAVTAGTCYTIRVVGFDSDSGTGTLTLSAPADSAASADKIRTGADPGDRLGYAVAAGDRINNDSFRDVIIGAYLNDTLGTNRGRVYALRGDTYASFYTFTGDADSDQFGIAVAGADCNSDGRGDIIVGANLYDAGGSNSGRVEVFNAVTGAELWHRNGFTAGDRFGYAVGNAGDVNNDGFDDVIVGAPYNDAGGTSAGRAYVLDGENGFLLWTVTGATAGENLGWAVAGIGDLDNDNKDDFAVGSPRYSATATNAGRISVYSGADRSVIMRIKGDAAGDLFGSSIAGKRFASGGSTFSMVAIGAPENDAGGSLAGRVKVYLRNITSAAANPCTKPLCLKYTMNGGNPGDRLGSSLSVGTLVGNGMADIVAGAPYADFAGSSSGAVYIFDGSTGSQASRLLGEAAGDRFGTSVADAADADFDGARDLLVGSPFNDFGGTDAGRAYLFYANTSADSPAEFSLFGSTERDENDPTVTSASDADLNGDGTVDSTDLTILLDSWGPCPDAAGCLGDISADGVVDSMDLQFVLFNWSI